VTTAEVPPSLSDRIRAAREAAILSQAELAERFGVSERTVQNWEAGARPKQASHRRMVKAFLAEHEAAA